ncbi:hypothetical protein [Haloferax sp. DFSO60]|uniref:hypothetical protein n=1 Tax=Haloferax sp. DFSO60 TaxID=3388652 RepID=UPI003979B02D
MKRRALLTTCSGSFLTSIAGCLRTGSELFASNSSTDSRATESTTDSRATESTTVPLGDPLPYDTGSANDIFAPPGIDIRNESDEGVTLTVALEHDGDRFFEQTFDTAANGELSTTPVVNSHATYDVFVETADGRQATSEWSVDGEWNHPMLAVLVDDDGLVRIGCAWPQTIRIPVENEDQTEHVLRVAVSNGEKAITETRQTIFPGTNQLTIDLPIGDTYELTVETTAGSHTAEYVACDCWSTDAEVQLKDGEPTIWYTAYACE